MSEPGSEPGGTVREPPPDYRARPWGRSFDEYAGMFALSAEDLGKRILGCADGPASFNAIATRRGCRVVSADPIYRLDVAGLRARIAEAAAHIARINRDNDDEFVLESFGSADELIRVRLQAMETFLADFPDGLRAGRYVEASLPGLPFADGQFDIALCSHFLFLYSKRLDSAFHLEAITELRRTSAEVRVFPLSDLRGLPSPHVEPVVEGLRSRGLRAERVRVAYGFGRFGREMLRVS